MIAFCNTYSKNYKFSQFGEEGLVEECLKRMKIQTGSCVEIGGNDGMWLSNTALLIEKGWTGTFVEADFDLWMRSCENWKHNEKVKCICSFVNQDNINVFVSKEIDVLSVDTDSDCDYNSLKALEVKPKIVIVEVNSGFPPDERHVSLERGASYLSMLELGIEKGYFLLAHTGNLVLIDSKYRKLFPEIKGNGITNSELYFNTSWLKQFA